VDRAIIAPEDVEGDMTDGPSRALVEARAREAVRRRMREARMRLGAAAAGFVALCPLFFWAQGLLVGAVLAVVAALAVAAIWLGQVRPFLRRAREALAGDDVAAFRRRELDLAIRDYHQSATFVRASLVLAALAAALAAAFLLRERALGRSPDGRFSILLLVVVSLHVVVSTHALHVRLPRLERERRTLEEEESGGDDALAG
jgi:hypothetical protein